MPARTLALALACGAPVAWAGDGSRDAGGARAWYLPDQAKLQLAGNVGFLSPGVGWSWLDRRLTADAFVGWVPETLGGDVLSATAKLTWRPWAVRAGRRLELRPLTLALQLTYTFGGSYFVEQPSRFPDGYYPFPTALRAGLALGSAVSWPWGRGGRRIGAYGELVALDHLLLAWARNPRGLAPAEVFSLAVGTTIEF